MIIRKNPNLKYAILPKSKSLFLGYKKTNDKKWRYFMLFDKYIDMFRKNVGSGILNIEVSQYLENRNELVIKVNGSPVYLYDCTEQANQLLN